MKMTVSKSRTLHALELICLCIYFTCTRFVNALSRHVVVGVPGEGGVTHPWNPKVDYIRWARENHLESGDVAEFLYAENSDSVVAFPTKEAFDSCDMAKAKELCGRTDGKLGSCYVSVKASPQFVASGVESHCKLGQKVILQGLPFTDNARRVLKDRGESLAELHSQEVSSGAVPIAGGKYVTVGYPAGGIPYPWNPLAKYDVWAANKTNKLYIGDVAVFSYPLYRGQVYQFFRKVDFDLCRYWRAKAVCLDTHGVNNLCSFRMTSTTPLYFATGLYSRCLAGQKVTLTAKSKVYIPRDVTVGYTTTNFAYPWNPDVDYTLWKKKNPVYINDTLVFKYGAYLDSVYIVPTASDYLNCNYLNFRAYCNETDGVGGCYTSPLTAGYTFFVSGNFGSCRKGQRVAVRAGPAPL